MMIFDPDPDLYLDLHPRPERPFHLPPAPALPSSHAPPHLRTNAPLLPCTPAPVPRCTEPQPATRITLPPPLTLVKGSLTQSLHHDEIKRRGAKTRRNRTKTVRPGIGGIRGIQQQAAGQTVGERTIMPVDDRRIAFAIYEEGPNHLM